MGASTTATMLPKIWAQSGSAGPDKRLGYCVVGLGRISMGHFMPGVKASSRSRFTAVVSGHPDKARRIAAEYGLPESAIYNYDNYDQIRNNPDIDAVYIGLPNSMHAEYSIRAARAGKHVLSEKPMATNASDCKAMIAACDQAGKKMMIAYRCHFDPQHLRAREIIRSGQIGKVQAIESANGFNLMPGEWRANKKLAGGGPLMDMGIYSLNACRYLLGEEPKEIQAVSSVVDQDGRFNEVEETLSWTMKFPSGVVASCNTTFGANMSGFIRIHGSRGMLYLDPAFGYDRIHLTARIPGANHGDPPTVIDGEEPARDPVVFMRQADYFAGCVLDGKDVDPSGAEGLRDTELIAQIYHAAGLAF